MTKRPQRTPRLTKTTRETTHTMPDNNTGNHCLAGPEKYPVSLGELLLPVSPCFGGEGTNNLGEEMLLSLVKSYWTQPGPTSEMLQV